MNSKLLENVMQKELSRREFLSYIGAGILAVIGVTGLLKSLGLHTPQPKSTMGYGGGAYGGQKKLGL